MQVDRLLVASNRLPIALTKSYKGKWQAQPSLGGLVTALSPVLRARKGTWFGWSGTFEGNDCSELLADISCKLGYALKEVSLSKEEIDQYYFGFSNEIVWPLFHDLQSRCDFDPAYWNAYQTVNSKFAEAIIKNAEINDYIWIHDYHLALVAKRLRRLGMKNKIGFFLHIPFPSPDIFNKLPWRTQMLDALLDYDLVGFQTPRDKNNFIYCVESILNKSHINKRRQTSNIETPERKVIVGSFPISIDFKDFAQQAASRDIAEQSRKLRDSIHNNQIILGVDRLDYSKGIPEKLRAFRIALERFNSLHGKIALVQIVVPSREDIPQYQTLKSEIESLVGEINGRFSHSGWIPIHYMFRTLDRSELLAYYRAADIALITPLKDGMNLVAKEYCTSKIDKCGVLILSEFAGAASQLGRNALLVNPYDREGVANAIYRASQMSMSECQIRMQRLRKSIAKRDVFWWAGNFLQTAFTEETGYS